MFKCQHPQPLVTTTTKIETYQMLHCLRPTTSVATTHTRSSSPVHPVYSADNTPRSSTQPSPTVNLTQEYTQAVQTSSYGEIWSKIHPENSNHIEQLEAHEEEELLEQVLHPNRELVREALRDSKPSTLTRLVSSYFDHSEHTSHLCLLLHHSIHRAHSFYAPLYDLLDVLPLDSESDFLSQSQCDRAYDVFMQFDHLDNPFPCPDSHNFHDMRCCFSELKEQLDCRLHKSRSRIHLLRRMNTGSAICLIGTAVGVTISAIAIAAHALIALVAVPFLPPLLLPKINKREQEHLAQLDAAAKGTYVLHNDLDTIDRLVVLLHTAVESDRLLIRLGLERGRDRHPIQQIVKHLRKNQHKFLSQLLDLDEHLCLCFAAINRARSLLLQEIQFHQTQHT